MSGSGVISRLTEACAKEKGVLMLMNLDNFGLFNEIYGVEVGDALLENCVRIINEVTEGDDIKGRLGGDEFIVLAHVNNTRIEDILHELTKKADRWSGKEIKELSLSAGAASKKEFPDYSIDELVGEADQRMYKIKSDYYLIKGIDRRKN